MKKTNKSNVVIIGNNNKVLIGRPNTLPNVVNVVLISMFLATVLTISLCCPDLLADFICWLIGRVD